MQRTDSQPSREHYGPKVTRSAFIPVMPPQLARELSELNEHAEQKKRAPLTGTCRTYLSHRRVFGRYGNNRPAICKL